MKQLVLMVIMSVIGMSETMTKQKSSAVCQSYIDQAKLFETEMKDDAVSHQTMAFYKQKIFVHCGSLVAKVKFEKKSFSEMMMKNDKTTVPECKLAIDMASRYSENKVQSELIVAAHRENIADNCGSLVASHVSAYCLYGDEN